jgi:hypothetical protein
MPVRIVKQTWGHDQGDTEHIVRRFARAEPQSHLADRELPFATKSEIAPVGCLVPYSHSIVAGGLPLMS